MTKSKDNEARPLAEREFMCSACTETAGKIWLEAEDQAPKLFVSSFAGRFQFRVRPQSLTMLKTAITYGNISTLFRMDHEYAPFYCPSCDACYCKEHWKTWHVFDDDGWADSTRGVCPSGHERMIND